MCLTNPPVRFQPDDFKPTVLKFGGSSVADAAGFNRAREIVREHRGQRPVVIVSAMSRVTDALLESFCAAKAGESVRAERIVEEISARHLAVARELLTSAYEASAREIVAAERAIAALLRKVAAARPATKALEDLIVSYGEQLSSGLLAAALLDNELPAEQADARRCIVTDGNHGNAEPLLEQSEQSTRAALEPLVRASVIPVLGGFIGMSEGGETTTLGRNGSDYTASIVGSALNAREIQIWTDVPGVLTADPRLVKGARTIPQLSYAEATELARFGAKVLDPRMIHPAAKRRIPLRVRNTFDRGGPETLVGPEAGRATTRIKAIAHKAGLMVLHTASAHVVRPELFLAELLGLIGHHHIDIYAAVASATGATLIIDGAGPPPSLLEKLNKVASVNALRTCEGVCLVGGSLRCVPDVLEHLRGMAVGPEQLLAAQLTCNNNLILAIVGGCAGKAVTRLHSAFIERGGRMRWPAAE